MTPNENGYPTTPRLTPHARERCAEMGLTTGYVKKCWREARVDYPGPPIHGEENRIRKSEDGKVAIAYMDTDEGPVILTVLWQGDRFVRAEDMTKERADGGGTNN